MASLFSLGISPSEASTLSEYEELGYFLEKVQEHKNREDTRFIYNISLAVHQAILGTQSNKSMSSFKRWQNKLAEKLKIKNTEGQEETLFSKLKMKKAGKGSTGAFSKLRR